MAMARNANSSRVAFWRDLIERRRRGGVSVDQCCAAAGVSPASFYQWQRKLRGDAAPARKAQPDRRTPSQLVPVHILPDALASRDDSAGMLEVELHGEIRLRIPSACDAATLEVVLVLQR
jgi:transposase-like protein